MRTRDTACGKIDIAELRGRLETSGGPHYWRSLDELAATPEFQAFVEDEFPSQADDLKNPATRRDLLRVMAAAFGLAGGSPPYPSAEGKHSSVCTSARGDRFRAAVDVCNSDAVSRLRGWIAC